MEELTVLLALLGGLALAWGLARALLRLLWGGAEGYLARELSEVRGRRGDLTGMEEARSALLEARRRRRRNAAAALLWGGVLAGAPFTPWTRSIYVLCSSLWILHLVRPDLRRS